MAEAHSYGVSYAEDILFVTVKVRNESGDWCAENENGEPILDDFGNQKCGEGMVLPDGTKLNHGKGFDYEGTSLASTLMQMCWLEMKVDTMLLFILMMMIL